MYRWCYWYKMTMSKTKKYDSEVNLGGRTAYGFFPQMKAEGIALKKEKSGAIVIGTNPGYQNGVLIIDEITVQQKSE